MIIYLLNILSLTISFISHGVAYNLYRPKLKQGQGITFLSDWHNQIEFTYILKTLKYVFFLMRNY